MPSTWDRLGYTPKQAEAQQRKIERAVAKACDDLAALQYLIPDSSVSVGGVQEEVLEIGRKLEETVARRTRGRH
jgi:hypothetical protein